MMSVQPLGRSELWHATLNRETQGNMKCWQAGYWAEVEDAGRGLYSVFQCRSLHSYLRHPLSRSLVDAMVYLFWNLKSLDCGRKAWSQCGMCWPQILLSVIGCCRSLSGWSGRGNAEECPEGQPEICAPGRTDLACNNCLPKYYPTGSGDCKACEDYDTLGFYVAVIVMWCGGRDPFTGDERWHQSIQLEQANRPGCGQPAGHGRSDFLNHFKARNCMARAGKNAH